MSRRLAKINKNIQRVFGEIMHAEAELEPGVLVTISHVDTTENMRSATVWLYIQPPEKEASVLTALQKQMYDLQGAFNRALQVRPLPRLHLKIDHGAAHADRIDRTLKTMSHE